MRTFKSFYQQVRTNVLSDVKFLDKMYYIGGFTTKQAIRKTMQAVLLYYLHEKSRV